MEKLIPSYLDEKISKATVYGIGGVHKYLVVPNGDPKTYTAKEVKASLNKLIGKTKSELEVLVPTIDPKARVFDTTVSNLILVDGLFTGLGVSEVEVAKVDLADGVLVYEDW